MFFGQNFWQHSARDRISWASAQPPRKNPKKKSYRGKKRILKERNQENIDNKKHHSWNKILEKYYKNQLISIIREKALDLTFFQVSYMMVMKKLSRGDELWLDLWIKIIFKLSWIVLFKTIEHKQIQIVAIQALSNINNTLDF